MREITNNSPLDARQGRLRVTNDHLVNYLHLDSKKR